MTRRDLMRLMLASALAEAIDVEQLLWVPKPIISVPAMPLTFAWEDALSVLFQFTLAADGQLEKGSGRLTYAVRNVPVMASSPVSR